MDVGEGAVMGGVGRGHGVAVVGVVFGVHFWWMMSKAVRWWVVWEGDR